MLKPRMPVRRFDVFAEYNRQKALTKGVPEDEAAGYGLWVAKVVASGGSGRSIGMHAPSGKGGKQEQGEQPNSQEAPEEPVGPKWHVLGGEDQTDEMYESQVVRRMGEEFYNKVFLPAIEDAVREDRTYTSIRDTIRRDWKP
ncbi:MAG: hypothetical protein M3014_02210 [Chloroflexota bacterium]|nr:hypothetical protein [Chloroflexota bacterium]